METGNEVLERAPKGSFLNPGECPSHHLGHPTPGHPGSAATGMTGKVAEAENGDHHGLSAGSPASRARNSRCISVGYCAG